VVQGEKEDDSQREGWKEGIIIRGGGGIDGWGDGEMGWMDDKNGDGKESSNFFGRDQWEAKS
jgi:hypothetical protein